MDRTHFRTQEITAAIGSLIMAMSVAVSIWLAAPFVKEELNYRLDISDNPLPDNAFSIRIPSLKISSLVSKNIDPWNPKEYKKALEDSVAHAKGTSLPNEQGTIFLFAHSSANPIELMRTNLAFYRLDKAEIGDSIELNYQGRKYFYSIKEKKIVLPHEVDYLLQDRGNVLILQTCYPVGSDSKRFLVFAELEETN